MLAHVLVAFLLASLQGLCLGHGMLQSPAARNVLAKSDDCWWCLAAGGPAVVGGDATFPNGRAGMCGDPADGPRKHEAGGKYAQEKLAGRYEEGSVLKLDVTITAFHKGRFEFRICKINKYDPDKPKNERAQLTEECLDQNALVQASVPEAQNPGDKYFHLGQENKGTPCPSWLCPVPGTVHTAYYQLPEGLVCDGVTAKCVLQWYWVTGNSCNPPGEPAQYANSLYGDCGEPGGAYPEEFWNCADIAIMPKGTPIEPIDDGLPKPGGDTKPIPAFALPQNKPSCTPGDKECYCQWLGQAGFYPELANGCKTYYICGMEPLYKRCPASRKTGKRLLFSMETNSCAFAEHVYCPPDHAALVEAAQLSECRGTDNPRACQFCGSLIPPQPGIYADTAGGCKGFFECSANAKQYIACASGLLFSSKSGQCDWPSSVECPAGRALRAARQLPVEVAARGVTAQRQHQPAGTGA